ncbi:DNA polymerase III subunit chi [Methylotenera sp. N17]|jgi:DNA polymerase-3 subunit chi|uniref:DNA polymerase III subunit chi n=1 Tax=Methylotenera sp. N17 TaxID=1502761 RepID=UPI000648017C|nr:DNA polymerase III subunit chi [Methylotenera sp. N17]
MTSIGFYFNVADKPLLVNQLVQKALRQHRQVTLFTADEATANALSDQIWQFEPTAFNANVLANHALAQATPVLVEWQAQRVQQDDLLINLQPMQLTMFSRFKHLFELVGLDELDKAEARKRFAFYRDRGYDIKSVDMLKKSI